MINLIFNEVFRQSFEIVDIMAMPDAAIWRCSTDSMFGRATLSFVIFLEKVFILNLGLEQRNYLKALSMSFIVQWTVIVFAETSLGCFWLNLIICKFPGNLRFYFIYSDIGYLFSVPEI